MSEKYYVFFDDDYPEMGGYGFEEFDSEKQAAEFISNRINEVSLCALITVENYRIIRGRPIDFPASCQEALAERNREQKRGP